jgi:hypothetical protein
MMQMCKIIDAAIQMVNRHIGLSMVRPGATAMLQRKTSKFTLNLTSSGGAVPRHQYPPSVQHHNAI